MTHLCAGGLRSRRDSATFNAAESEGVRRLGADPVGRLAPPDNGHARTNLRRARRAVLGPGSYRGARVEARDEAGDLTAETEVLHRQWLLLGHGGDFSHRSPEQRRAAAAGVLRWCSCKPGFRD